jgi:sugar (pentulose or hexulose) kinase
MLLTDRAGRPLTPAIMYDDGRATAEAPEVVAAWADVSARNGYHVQLSWALPKLVWALRHVAGAADGRLLQGADYVMSWLAGGAVATDASHSLKTGFDLVRNQWPRAELERLGIPLSVLPDVQRTGSPVGSVSREAAEATGLPAGVPIFAGMTDGCASQVASGAMRVGEWNSALGTTFVLKGVTRELLHDPSGAVYSHVHPDGGWLPGGASSSGAGVLAATFPRVDPAEMDRAAAEHVPTDVVRYPLARPGERFPFARPDAEPFQLGTPRDEAEQFAALLQGVAFVERLSLEYVQALGASVEGPVALTGGATRSAFWTQIRADVLGRSVRLTDNPESSVGMAIVAAANGGSVAGACERMVRTRQVVEPRPAMTARYQQIYDRFVEELERRGYIAPGLVKQGQTA